MKKIVVLTSGGIDSLTMIAFLSQEGNEVFPFFVDWGQKNLPSEFLATRNFLNELTLEYENIHPIETATLKMKNDTPLHSTIEDSPNSSNKDDNFVPARNLIFLSLALAYARKVDAKIIAIGSHKEREYPFPDSSYTFLKSFEDTANKALYPAQYLEDINPMIPIRIQTPWLNLDFFKSDVVKWASQRKLPLHLTWTCYDNTSYHCGVCRACLDRQEAYKINNMPDPTIYQE